MALAALAFAPALALGSFLNVVAARVPLRRSLAAPRSSCLGCGSAIDWYDNIPIASYCRLGGRCRHCRSTIGWTYPAVELATGILVAASFGFWGLGLRALAAAVFCAVLVVVSAIDLRHRIIPNRIVLPATLFVLVLMTAAEPSAEWAIAGLGAAAFLLAAALAYPGGMGMGDVKLALLLGVALGRTVPIALMVGMLSALVPSAVLLARHGRAARKMGIPFGPFLARGGLVALFSGHRLLEWYLGFVG